MDNAESFWQAVIQTVGDGFTDYVPLLEYVLGFVVIIWLAFLLLGALIRATKYVLKR